MLAYVFWHRPHADADRTRYEDSLLRFQAQLGEEKPPGFIAASSFRIEAVPWLGDQPGYEDWYLVQGSWALDPLNAFAVAGRTQTPHDAAAAQMDQGHGGLYAHAGGDAPTTEHSSVYWLTRPRGIDWRAALGPVRAKCPQAISGADKWCSDYRQSSPSRRPATPRLRCRPAGRRGASAACALAADCPIAVDVRRPAGP